MMACCLFSCDSETGDKGQSEFTNLTPMENKAKLEEIGIKAIQHVKAQDYRTMLEVLDKFAYIAGDIYILDNNSESASRLSNTLSSVFKNNDVNAVRSLSRVNDNDIYNLARYSGVYTYDEDNYDWIRTDDSDNLEFHFMDDDRKKCSVIISKEGNENKVNIEDNDGERYELLLPEKAIIGVKRENTELLTAVIDMKVDSDVKNADITLTLTSGKTVYSQNVKANNESAGTYTSLKIDGVEIFKNTTDVNGYNLTNYQGYEELYENDNIHSLFGKAIINTVLMNELEVKVACIDIDKLVSEINNLYDRTDYDEEEGRSFNEEMCNIINGYVEANMYYTDGSNAIAKVVMKPAVEHDDYNDEDYYYYTPYLVFNVDNSEYSFESYFNEGGFNDLIDITEDLVEDYDDIFD